MKIIKIVSFIPELVVEWECDDFRHRTDPYRASATLPVLEPGKVPATDIQITCRHCNLKGKLRELVNQSIDEEKYNKWLNNSEVSKKADSLDAYAKIMKECGL